MLKKRKGHTESTTSSGKYGVIMSYRRISYTVEFKILVVEWLQTNDHNIHKTAGEFNIGRKLVREWEKKYNELLKMNFGATCTAKRQKLNSRRTPLSIELDQQELNLL